MSAIGVAIRVLWLSFVLLVLALVGLDVLMRMQAAPTALQVTQLWSELTAVGMVLTAVTAALWLAMWRPHRD